LIEITEQEHIAERLLSLLGIDEAVWLQVGALPRVAAQFEAGRSKEDKLSAVQYLRFLLPPDARAAFLDPTVRVQLLIDHPRYQAQTAIEGSARASLSDDLRAAQ
jgi:hypothetical protein